MPNYLLTAVKQGETSPEEVVRIRLQQGFWGLEPSARFLLDFRVGDRCCFYAAGTGVVASATVSEPPRAGIAPSLRVFGQSDRTRFTLRLSDIAFMGRPVALDAQLRAELDAFRGKDLAGPWGWFVQTTSRPPSKANRPETRDKNWDEYKDPESGVQFFVDFLEASFPHLQAKCPIYHWYADMRTHLVFEAWARANLTVHQQVIWVKTRGVLSRRHFMWQHESCLYGWREGGSPTLKPPANQTSVWHVDQVGETKEEHPTQKPVELFKRPMLWHLKKGELCWEPFSGSGTSIIAAETTERRCFAMEQEPAYVDVAVQRWEAFTGQTATRIPRETQNRPEDESERSSKVRA